MSPLCERAMELYAEPNRVAPENNAGVDAGVQAASRFSILRSRSGCTSFHAVGVQTWDRVYSRCVSLKRFQRSLTARELYPRRRGPRPIGVQAVRLPRAKPLVRSHRVRSARSSSLTVNRVLQSPYSTEGAAPDRMADRQHLSLEIPAAAQAKARRSSIWCLRSRTLRQDGCLIATTCSWTFPQRLRTVRTDLCHSST